jgi:hypothetical protein
MVGSNVEKASLNLVPFTFMKQLTIQRNPMDVNNVGKPTLIPFNFELMNELTLEKTLWMEAAWESLYSSQSPSETQKKSHLR